MSARKNLIFLAIKSFKYLLFFHSVNMYSVCYLFYRIVSIFHMEFFPSLNSLYLTFYANRIFGRIVKKNKLIINWSCRNKDRQKPCLSQSHSIRSTQLTKMVNNISKQLYLYGMFQINNMGDKY